MSGRVDGLLALLRAEIAAQFGDAGRPCELLRPFLERRPWKRACAARLVAIARGREGDALPIRLLAILILEDRLVDLPVERGDDWRFVLQELGLLAADAGRLEVDPSLLEEGYSALDLPGFVAQLQRNLGRLRQLYAGGGGVARPEALRTFLHLVRGPCRAQLGRYLLTPEEVVAEILRSLRVTTGLRAPLPIDHELVDDEAERALAELPGFEARVVAGLTAASRIYWVSPRTGSLPNALVEYPLTTVVLVVKPPGSSVELEIKRAGLRGAHPLSVVYQRDGKPVPPSHRLAGGSILSALLWEARSAAKLSSFYRACHGEVAPVPKTLTISAIHSVPAGDSEIHLLDYLSSPELFGEGHGRMQAALERSVVAFDEQRGTHLEHLQGEVGLTSRFLAHVAPSQVVLVGTSSFRLEQLLELMEGGPASEEMLRQYGADDETTAGRLLADDLLLEILAVYTPPDVDPRPFGEYLTAAFGVAANRARADATFRSLVVETGRFWGTVLAMRAGSRGESFAARNVGLRAHWRDGEWRTGIVFMDHDNMYVGGLSDDVFRPLGVLPLIFRDDIHVGYNQDPDAEARTVLSCLRRIYRVDRPTWIAARAEFRAALRSSYHHCQQRIHAGEVPAGFFCDRFREQLLDWDRVVRLFLDRRAPAAGDGWAEQAGSFLRRRGYGDSLIREHLAAVRQYRGLLRKYSFLYRSGKSALSRSKRQAG